MSELSDCTDCCRSHPQARIAIVGAGFSGLLVLAHLVEQADFPLAIELFESESTPDGGVAYRTAEPSHLLNVRAERMGAFPDKPDDFYRWLQSPPGQSAAIQHGLAVSWQPDSYVPRLLYGYYLRQIFDETLRKAQTKAITVRLQRATVSDVTLAPLANKQLLLTAQSHGQTTAITVDGLVLATGNRADRPAFLPQPLAAGAQWVVDAWRPAADSPYPNRVADLAPDSTIVIVGTGLTMADAVLTLQAHGYRGSILAISRHGWLPTVHQHSKPYPAWAWTIDPSTAPRTALGLLRGLRHEIAHAATLGYDWRSVIDSLRPVTQTLWQQLDTVEKGKFMRRLFALWNIHRHRMAPAAYAQLLALQQSGSLHLIAGKIDAIKPNREGLTVTYHPAGANQPVVTQAALVINCTGPTYDSMAGKADLLTNLCNRGLLTLGPLAAGVEVDSQGSAKGQAASAIFPLGSLLVGQLLECTAVPELRNQTKAVAGHLLQRLATRAKAQTTDDYHQEQLFV